MAEDAKHFAGMAALAEEVEALLGGRDDLHATLAPDAAAWLAATMVGCCAGSLAQTINGWESSGVDLGDWRLRVTRDPGAPAAPSQEDIALADKLDRLKDRFGSVPLTTLYVMDLLHLFRSGLPKLQVGNAIAGHFTFSGRQLTPTDLTVEALADAAREAVSTYAPVEEILSRDDLTELRFSINDPMGKNAE